MKNLELEKKLKQLRALKDEVSQTKVNIEFSFQEIEKLYYFLDDVEAYKRGGLYQSITDKVKEFLIINNK